MQNHLLAILHGIVRILRLCRQRVWGAFVLPRGDSKRLDLPVLCRLGALGFSADFDSARLDAVSRSVLWGAGVLSPEPVPAKIRTPRDPATIAAERGGIQLRIHR